MTQYIIIIVILIITSCSDNQTNVIKHSVPNTDTLTIVNSIRSDTGTRIQQPEIASFVELQEFYTCFKNIIQPVSFNVLSHVYYKPDTSSNILTTLNFNSPIKLTVDNGKQCDWYEIEVENNKGYIKASDVATHSFNSLAKNKRIRYFIITDLPGQNSDQPAASMIYKYDIKQSKFIDTFEVRDYGANIIKQINSSGWKNVDLMLYFDNTNGCCGCTLQQHYLIDANNTFQKLFTTSTYVDDGGEGAESYSHVTLPTNPETNNIIYTEYEYGGLSGKNNKPVLDKKGRQKMGVIKDLKKHYKWDGVRLTEQK